MTRPRSRAIALGDLIWPAHFDADRAITQVLRRSPEPSPSIVNRAFRS